MTTEQMGSYLWWMCTLQERACGLLLPKIVTSTSPARDQVCHQTGGVTRWLVTPPFPPNFVHLSGGRGFDSRDRTNFSQNNSCKKGTIPSLTLKTFLSSFLPLNLPSLTLNYSLLFLFLLIIIASCTNTHLAFPFHLSYHMHMRPSVGYKALAQYSLVALTSTSIRNYSCQLFPHCTSISQCHGLVIVS